MGVDIVDAVLSTYRKLPKRAHPGVRPNGSLEWSILAGFVIEYNGTFDCVAIGIGVKCLPAIKIPLQGDMVHDCHAEILAKRAFIRYLLNEMTNINNGDQSRYLTLQDGQYRLTEGVKLHMYISALPCGDASMIYTADHQDDDEAALYSAIPSLSRGSNIHTELVRGRLDYSRIGAIRTKPGRADASSTSSLSCSDKLATFCLLGVQGGVLANIIEPIYIDKMIIGGVFDNREKYLSECYRALYTRLEASLSGCLPDTKYRFHKPEISFTDTPYEHSKEQVESKAAGVDVQPAIECANYVANDIQKPTEIVVSGLKNGNFKRKGPETPYFWKYRSRLCKLDIMRAYVSLSANSGSNNVTYYDVKNTVESSDYRQAKGAIRSHPSLFAGWIVTDKKYTMFDREGNFRL